jgi:16S rRNA (uracil1498-N3)-methyltransferase
MVAAKFLILLLAAFQGKSIPQTFFLYLRSPAETLGFYMQYFYAPEAESNSSLLLPEEESFHLCKVLRMNIGEEITLLNGKGKAFKAHVEHAHPKKSLVITQQMLHNEAAPSNTLHLFVCPTKTGERMEWLLEKGVEAGLNAITFVQSARTEKSRINLDRLHKIALAALKQCGRLWLPEINPLSPLHEVAKYPANSKGFGYCGEEQKMLLPQWSKASGESAFLIGPEGDFTQAETEMLKENNWQAISLGETRYRTETAALMIIFAHELERINNL